MLGAMDDASRQHRQAVWTRHWASGAAHSCAGSYAETYGGDIERFWRSVMAHTAAGSRVLDIATGSGALPRLWLAQQPALPLHIDAVDLAGGTPAWAQALPAAQARRLHFHAGVSAEALPFADGCFDLVASQYGLEYADLARAVPELLRVRARAGRVALVMHHAQSRPVTLAAVEIAHIDWLRGPEGLLGATREMLGPMALAATAAGRVQLSQDPKADAVREAFNQAQDALQARTATPDGADILGEVQDQVAQLLNLAVQRGAEAARLAWVQVDRQLADARWRLQDLRDAALDEPGVQAVCESLRQAGLEPRVATLHEQGYLMGWTLQAG